MKISERKLRTMIRSIIVEQVVGYSAPSKTYDDPLGDDDHQSSAPASNSSSISSSTDSSDSVSSDGGGYDGVGDMGVDVNLDSDSQEKEKATSLQVRKLSKQRQKDLSGGSAIDAESSGEQLSMATRMRN